MDIIEYLIFKNVLSPSTLLNNIFIIEDKASLMKFNYSLLDNNNCFDFRSKYYSDELLLLDREKLRNRFLILNLYKMNSSIYTYLLSNIDKLKVLDIMIENNIPLYLFMNIIEQDSIDSILIVKKIIIASRLGINYCDEEMMLKKIVIEKDKFLIPDNMI